MIGILYLLISIIFGAVLVKKVLVSLNSIGSFKSLVGTIVKLPKFMVYVPASFYVGVLFTTWLTYISAWLTNYFFPSIEKPLFWGNIISLTCIMIFLIICFFIDFRKNWESFLSFPSKIIPGIIDHSFEVLFCFANVIGWSFFMLRSFYIKGDLLYMGISAFSDFGATVPLIRSFSLGSNFPTGYPHFANAFQGANNINYHFMFQFLSGNLEYLGLRLDWAFNLPSILSIVALMMLLYSLAVLITGDKYVGLLTSFLFLFRSSFAAFTYMSDRVMKEGSSIGNAIVSMMTKADGNIGNTIYENWGFWAQKVYINKRHLSFSMGIAILVIILFIPLFIKFIEELGNDASDKNQDAENENENDSDSDSDNVINIESSSGATLSAESRDRDINEVHHVAQENIGSYAEKKSVFKSWLLNKDMWIPQRILEPIFAGILLGLATYWNGAMVICALLVLAGLAVFSKRRLELLIVATVTIVLTFAQTKFFMQGSAVGSIEFYTNFVMHDKSIIDVLKYYFELLGILPLVLAAGLFVLPRSMKWLTVVFLFPFMIANLLKFSPDVGANHVIIIFSVILLNICVSATIVRLMRMTDWYASIILLLVILNVMYYSSVIYQFNSIIWPVILGLVIAFLIFIGITKLVTKRSNAYVGNFSAIMVIVILLSVSGIVDMKTLYNMDMRAGRVYMVDDPIIKWASEETKSNAVFLTMPKFDNLILLGGRTLFVGYGYFTNTAGYDGFKREEIVKEIYTAQTQEALKNLVKENGIDYIVVENANRLNTEYGVNEALISSTYPLVRAFEFENTKIYQVK